jgi:hypothetical protein
MALKRAPSDQVARVLSVAHNTTTVYRQNHAVRIDKTLLLWVLLGLRAGCRLRTWAIRTSVTHICGRDETWPWVKELANAFVKLRAAIPGPVGSRCLTRKQTFRA